AKMLGAKSIAVTRSGSKRGELIAAGADNVIVVGEEDVRDSIFDITDGLGADLIYDAVGGPGLGELAWATKRLGRIIIYGALGATDEETRLPLGACFFRGVIRQKEPNNLETPVDRVDSFLSPTELFYVRSHSPAPKIELASYRLQIDGAVRSPFSLTYKELRNMPAERRVAVLECA